jgi:quercetin dioxygenase-like cupin family protein
VASNYVYEPAGAIDGWAAVGDESCMVHIQVTGMIEYPDENG